MSTICRLLRIDTSLTAPDYLPIVIRLAVGLQLLFYIFTCIAFSNGNQSNIAIVFIVAGFASLLIQSRYVIDTFAPHRIVFRKWNRMHLFYPYFAIYNIIATYFFAVCSILFQSQPLATVGSTKPKWEDILPELDSSESAYFSFQLILVVVLFFIQIALAQIHRKGWCDGKSDLDLMIEVLDKEAKFAYENKVKAKKVSLHDAKVREMESMDDMEQGVVSRNKAVSKVSKLESVRQNAKREPSAAAPHVSVNGRPSTPSKSRAHSRAGSKDPNPLSRQQPQQPGVVLRHVPYGGHQVADSDSD